MIAAKTATIGSYRLLRPLLFALAPESAHALALLGLRLAPRLVPKDQDDPRLSIEVAGIRFPSPVGLAAGFDKDGEAWQGALSIGFGFAEIGSVTPRPQPGNQRPRLFRSLRDGAIVNRMGFNSAGAEFVKRRLARSRRLDGVSRLGILGVNLGKNKETANAHDDYAAGVAALGQFADYLVVNISSPNTPGLRALQNPQAICDLSLATRGALEGLRLRRPLFLKIAPDLSVEDLGAIAQVALAGAFDGLIVGNTTVSRPGGLDRALAEETGGLSGLPLKPLATEALRNVYRLTAGKIPLIGVGGIADGADAYARIRAGASLIQLYSALVFRGPGLVRAIKRYLLDALSKDGFSTIAEAIGADHRNQ
jgi:dihydroorotate dehydrogenase